MKFCLGGKHADWDKTSKGRLHPSGDGYCRYPYKIPPLPASRYWMGKNAPEPSGGFINRKEVLKDHCVYYLRESE